MQPTNSQFKKGSLTITQTASTSEHSAFSRMGFVKKHKYRLMLAAFLIVFAASALYNLGYMSVQWDEMPHLNGGLLLIRGQTWDYMTTYGYYPPLFDLVTTGYFQVFGVNEVAGRLVAVTFSVLAIWLLFEFTKRTYGVKNALVASVLLGTMPGFFWLSRVTMLETMLIFFFTLVMFAFYIWLSKDNSNRALIYSGLALGIGILAKYQIVVAALAMMLSILFLGRKRLKLNLAKFLLIFAIAVLVVVPWFVMIYHYDGITKFQTLQYVMSEGGQDRPAYSNRFQPIPVYYLTEMVMALQRFSRPPHLSTHLCFRIMWIGIVCLPKKKTGHILPNLVYRGVCFLYTYPQQAVAVRNTTFPHFSHLRRMFHYVPLQHCPRLEAQTGRHQR